MSLLGNQTLSIQASNLTSNWTEINSVLPYSLSWFDQEWQTLLKDQHRHLEKREKDTQKWLHVQSQRAKREKKNKKHPESSMSNPWLLGSPCLFFLSWFLQVLGHGTNTVENATREMSVGILGRNQAESWPFGTCSAMEGRAWRAPSFCEVWRRFRKPGWLSSTQIARKGAKSSRSSNPRVGNVLSPLGTVRHQPFLSWARPKVGGRGSQRARGEPRGRTCCGAAGTHGGTLPWWPAVWSPGSSHHASPSFGRLC